MNNGYRLHWFLVVVGNTILGVYGGALQENAEESARKHDGYVVHIGAYGMPFHAGDRLPS